MICVSATHPHSCEIWNAEERQRGPAGFAAAENPVSLCLPSEHRASPASCILRLHRHMWALALWVWRGGMQDFRSCCGPGSQSPEMAYAPPLAGDGRNKWASARAVLPCTRLIRGGGVSGGEPLPLPCPQRYSHFTPVGNPFCLDREDLPPRQGRGEVRGWAGRGWPSAGAFERFEGAAFP